MKKKCGDVLFLMFIIIPCLLSAKTAAIESRWQKTPLKIDGDRGDWMAPSVNFEKSVQVDYAFCNDAENLYLVFIFKDQKYLSSIAKTGMTIWVNTEGKKKNVLGVRFQKKTLAAADLIAAMEKKNGPLPADKKNDILSKPAYTINQFTVINKDEEDQTALVFKEMSEPEFAALPAPGRLVFEFKLPIGPVGGLGLDAGKTVMVGFDWGGRTKEMRQEMVQDGSYEPGENRTYPDTPDYDADSISTLGSGGSMPSMRGPKHYIFWCELTLATGT